MQRSSNRLFPLAFGLSALLAAGGALAATEDAAPGRTTVDIAKVKARADEAFTAADKDANGTLTKDEFATMEPSRFHHRMQRGMHHGDSPAGAGPMGGKGPGMGPMGGMGKMGGPPSAEERAQMHKAVFAALDADGNGSLSPEEFDKHHEVMARMRHDRMFDRLDANKDGVLSRDEMPSPTDRLTKLDTNGDGQVTPEEMRAKRGSPAE